MQLTGAEIVVRALQDEGVTHVFGYPGGAVLYIYDEIFKQDKFSTSWCGTSRPPCMRRMPIRARASESAWRWSPAARA